MNREFRGVWIPKEIWLNKDLTPLEKVYLIEIDSLDNDEKGCYASNKHFEKIFGQTKSNVSRIIKNLEQKGWINISYIYNGKEVDRRIIKISRPPYPCEYCKKDNRYYQNDKEVLSNLVEGYYQNDKESITILDKQLDNILSCEDANLRWNDGGKSSTKDKDKDKESYNPPKGNDEVDELFQTFWKEYPKKRSKGDAEKWFKKNKPTKELVDLMINKIKQLKETEQWKKEKGQFIPYPASWLNSTGWEDEINVDDTKPKYDTSKIYHDEYIGDYRLDENGGRIFV